MVNFGLYVILTEPELPHADIARICVDEDVRYLQLREKNLPDIELLRLAETIRSITDGTSTRFVFNDRFDLALVSGADGVHFGQDDTPIEVARQFLPDRITVGLSTHSISQATEAVATNPDYIGFGPIYRTPTKAVPDPVVGTDALREVLKISSCPVVAIGGINRSNLDSVIEAGARNVAMVRELVHTRDSARRIADVQKRLRSSA